MELSFGTAQVHTSERLRKHPLMARIFHGLMGYTNVGNYARFTVFKKIIGKIDLSAKSQILDLGTGYGEYAISLAKALPQSKVHALDIDSERIASVDYAISQSALENIETHCKPIEKLNVSAFDFIFSIDVFEHISPYEMPFKSCYDRLKPGGHFLVKIPTNVQKTILPEKYFEEHNHWLEEEHVGQIYDLDGLKHRFESEGFDVIHASYSDGWLSRFAWELSYLGKKAGFLGQLIALPISKLFIHLDRVFHHNRWGNAIQVVGKKPL